MISKKTDSGTKIYRFEISNVTAQEYLRIPSADPEYAQDAPGYYDSSLEQKFADVLSEHLGRGDPLGWHVTREPEPLIAGGRAMLPDFVLERFGRRVYLEIVGFWTPDYIKRKAAKLRELLQQPQADESAGQAGHSPTQRRVDMLVAIDSSLSCSQISEISDMPGVFTFDKSISVKPVLEHLKKIDRMLEQDAVEGTQIAPDDLGADMIHVRDVALKYGVPEGAIPAILERHAPGRYTKAGPYAVSVAKASEVHGMLGNVKKFVDACDVMTRSGIPEACHADVLSHLGYDVVWPDLDPANAEILKKPDANTS